MDLPYIKFRRQQFCVLFLVFATILIAILCITIGTRTFGLGFLDIYEKRSSYRTQDTVHNVPNIEKVSVRSPENKDDNYIYILAKNLQHKLENVIPGKQMKVNQSCQDQRLRNMSCDVSGCLRTELPESMMSRVSQLVTPTRFHYSDQYQKVLEDMADSVPGYYDIILVTGASSNHYRESKALLYNLHKFVYPYLRNFTLIYYDIGLTKAQREDISRKCKCHVVRFPFSKFPEMVSELHCYIWKPLIVRAHAQRCNILHWLDASIRFSEIKNFSGLETLYHRARIYGGQGGSPGGNLPRVTLGSMAHFFGDELCAYHPFRDTLAGFMIFHNEPFMRDAVLRPWTACALNKDCMCPYGKVNVNKALYCNMRRSGYSMCHRFEQSALNIIYRKLFQDKSHHILREDIMHYMDVKRGDTSFANNL